MSTSMKMVGPTEAGFTKPMESSESAVMRPFYFIVVVWGQTFRDYLCDFCLPSLLAPNNIPVIRENSGSKFLFCTTPQDWLALSETPIFLKLKDYIEPHFIEIALPSEGKSGCEHMGIGHKLAAQKAFEDKAFGVFLTPDLMVSDGTVRTLKKCAQAGYKVVLTAALRFGEEPLFEHLRSYGLLQEGDRHSESGRPLSISGRQMVKAGIRSFHSQTKRYEWEAPYFSSFPCACWWDVPGEEGVILHSFSWAPLLCDYAAVVHHDTSTFDVWTLDGDYIFQNFKNPDDMYIVKDSDDIMLVSWAPLADRPQKVAPNLLKGLPVVGEWIKGGILRAAFLSGIFDSLKREIFFLPVTWHGGPLSTNWERRGFECQKVLTRFLGDVLVDSKANPIQEKNPGTTITCSGSLRNAVRRVWLGLLVTMGRIWFIGSNLFHARERLKGRFQEALKGDEKARLRIVQRFGMIWKIIRGVPMRHF